MAMAEAQNPGNKKMRKELLQDILMFNILPRLPMKIMKCVGRLMCVSKEWHSFLTTPDFANMQLLYQNQYQNQKLLLLSARITSCPYKFCTIDCETPDKEGLLTASRRLPFIVRGGFCTILGSLHGLICIKNIWYSDDAQRTDLILWNPFTSDYKTLSKPSCDDDWYYMSWRGQFGLYYSTSDDDYKILCVTFHHHPKLYIYSLSIYSLKSDSWKNLETTNYSSKWNSYFPTPGILLIEKLYFLKQKQNHYGEDPSYFILMFNTKKEKLREIATPSTLRKERTERMGFMVQRGSIHLCVAFTDSKDKYYHTMELWGMNGDRDHWAKVVTYSPIERLSWREQPLYIMRNGDWLMFCRGDVYRRDMNKPTSDIICRFESMEISQGWPWKYMETLVSPNPNRYACHQVITPHPPV